MNDDKLMGSIGILGMVMFLFGGLILFEQGSIIGTAFGLTGIAFATLPYIYLILYDNDKGGKI